MFRNGNYVCVADEDDEEIVRVPLALMTSGQAFYSRNAATSFVVLITLFVLFA